MKKMIFAAMVAMLSFGAFAEDKVVELDGKQIVVTDIGKIFGSSEKQIDPKVMQGGFYIIAENGMGGNRFPNAEVIIKERFALAGIPISETLEGSAAAISFWTNGSLNLARADQAQAQGANSGKISGGIAAAAGSMAANGMGGAGALIGLFIPQDEKAIITGMVREKPFMNKGWLGSSLRSAVKDGEYGNQIEIQYSLPEEKEKQATQDVILKIAVDQWIKRYMTTNQSGVTQ